MNPYYIGNEIFVDESPAAGFPAQPPPPEFIQQAAAQILGHLLVSGKATGQHDAANLAVGYAEQLYKELEERGYGVR